MSMEPVGWTEPRSTVHQVKKPFLDQKHPHWTLKFIKNTIVKSLNFWSFIFINRIFQLIERSYEVIFKRINSAISYYKITGTFDDD